MEGLESTINYNIIWDETTNDCSTSGGCSRYVNNREMIPPLMRMAEPLYIPQTGPIIKLNTQQLVLEEHLCHAQYSRHEIFSAVMRALL